MSDNTIFVISESEIEDMNSVCECECTDCDCPDGDCCTDY